MKPRITIAVAVLCSAFAARISRADDGIDGVQPAAVDQPRIYLHLLRTANGEPLSPPAQPVKKNDPLSALLGGQASDQIEAFVDTGASGVMLSKDTADQLSIHAKPNIKFEDVGVAGSEEFGVSEPLFVSIAPYPNGTNYGRAIGPLSTQIRGSGGILESLAPGMDILGTPVIHGRVVVMDPTGLSKYEMMHTTIVEAGDPSIPNTRWHVSLNEVSFAGYTRTVPAGAKGPDASTNPMIGPSPFAKSDAHAPVHITVHGKTVTGTFLLDTGAATSMISTAKARELGLIVNDDGKVQGFAAKDQFSLAIGGLGGMKQSSGIFFDQLAIPTREGRPIVFKHAPLMISDVSMQDASGKTFTLDGVLGMNYLVASAEMTGGMVPDIGKIVDGPWKLIVVDLKREALGLEPNQ